MSFAQLLTPERVACDVEAPSKKRVLERLSELLSQDQTDITTIDVYNSLLARERLGGTGIGHGIAIPHGRLKNIHETLGAFIKLKQGVDFDSADRQPVDLIFALMVPEEATQEHLQTLAMLARMFSDEKVREQLHRATSAEELLQRLREAAEVH